MKNYRADIDGLRALAVIPVVLFHAGLSQVWGVPVARGGFVGVDIFFVISGYLISRIIHEEILNNSWSLSSFYERRIRRIFPAILVVYAVCLSVSVGTSVLNEASEIRNSVLASIFFVSNVYFSRSAGYFDDAIQSNPLLHTWSLSIEEQFYAFFPLLLLVLRTQSHRALGAVLGWVAGLSLAYSIYITGVSPDHSYYSILGRAWELLAGGIIAIARLPRLSRWVSEVAALAGLSAIGSSILFLDKSTPFPGVAAIWPVLGSAAIIYAGRDRKTWVSQCLENGLLRFFGRISYSLYLWHWPLIVYARMNGYGDKASALAVIGLSILVAYLSWRCVENPFRSGKNFHGHQVIFGGGMAMLLISLFAVVSAPANAKLFPMNQKAMALASPDQPPPNVYMKQGTCFITSLERGAASIRKDLCLRVDRERRNILVVGDSHAAQYFDAFQRLFPKDNVMYAAVAGCLPLPEETLEKQCNDFRKLIFNDFIPHTKLDAVVLAGRWPNGSASSVYGAASSLRSSARNVYIIGPNVEFTTELRRVMVLSALEENPELPRRYLSSFPFEVDREFSRIHENLDHITYLSYIGLMCSSQCPWVTSAGRPVVFDGNHLSRTGAYDFVSVIRNRIALD